MAKVDPTLLAAAREVEDALEPKGSAIRWDQFYDDAAGVIIRAERKLRRERAAWQAAKQDAAWKARGR